MLRHRSFRTTILGLAAAALVAGAAAPTAGALTAQQQFGIQDQSDPAMFSDPLLQALKPQTARYLADWQTARTPGAARDRLDAWYRAAIAHRVRPLLAFGHYVSLADYRAGRQIAPPSSRAFRRAFAAFRTRYPKVRDYAVWNEANHFSQPLYKRPKDAARLAHVARAACPRCTIVGLTLVNGDRTASIRYAKTYWRALSRADRAHLVWGVHNYYDVNRHQTTNLRFFLKTFPHGEVWLTESGGLAQYLSRDWRLDPQRQVRAARDTFAAAVRFRSRVKRLYWYQWRGTADRDPNVVWDSGLVNSNGTPRPAYAVALKQRFRTR
jgi:hypothetical protein